MDNIKKDYEGLKKVVIDENIGIKLQKDVTELQNGLKSNQSLAYTGSSISAENTLEGRTEGMKITGRTLYNIQRKQVYSLGTNLSSDCYTSKQSENLIDITLNKIEDGKYYFINIGGIDFKLLKPNTKYTVICEEVTNGLSIQIMSTGYNNQLSDVGTFKNNKTTITTNDLSIGDKGQILYIMFPYNKLGNYKVRNLMLVEGEIDCIGNYFEGLKSFGEAEQEGDKYKISLLSHGKNLFNNNSNYESQRDATAKKTTTGIEVYNSTSISWSCAIFKVKVPKNKNLYINYSTEGSIGDPFVVIRDLKDKDLYTFNATGGLFNTGENNEVKILFHCSKETVKHTSVTYSNLMISEENIKEYVKYKEDKKDILISAPLRQGDYLYEDTGQVKVNREVGQYTFTGDEGWTLGTQSSGWGEFDDTLVFYLEPFKAKTNTKFICDRFAYIDVININNIGIYNNIWGGKPHPVIRIKKSELSSNNLDGFKAWLKANPTTVIYQLATPVTEVAENCVDIDLDTYQEKTYFNILNSMPGILDFKIPSNLASIVQSHTKDIKILYDLIDRLLIPNLIENKSDLALLSLK